MLCPLELGNHSPCEGHWTPMSTKLLDDVDGAGLVLRCLSWECPICGTRWRSEELATHVTTPESRGENA